MVYAGVRMYETIGPSRAAVDSHGDLWLLSHGKLHHFGQDGLRRDVVDLAAIGAPPRPSDFDLHRDGRAVIADPDTSELVRCALPRGPCERLPARVMSVPGQAVLPLNAAKVHVDDAGGHYFVSDNAGHRVVMLDFAGRVMAQSTVGTLRHPNQLSLSGPSTLVVVDTDHHRLATLRVAAGELKLVGSQPTGAAAIARPGRYWPFDALRLPGGETAVLVAAHGMRDADLVFYDAAGDAVRRAELGAESDPFDVELWRGRIWVADATRYRFDSVDLRGAIGPPLEDAGFAAELRDAEETPRRWKAIRWIAQAGLVGFPLLGALFLWRLGAETAPSRAAAAPAVVRWIPARPALLRRLRWLTFAIAWVTLAAILAFVTVAMVRYPVAFFTGAGLRTGAPVLGVLVAIGIILFVVYRSVPAHFARFRLAAERDGLRFEVPSEVPLRARSKSGFAPWPQVYCDDVRLLAGMQLIPLRLPAFGAIFDPQELAAVMDAIPAANRLQRSQLNATAWKAGAFRASIVTVAVGMVAGLAILTITRRLL